ncbi:hypothetical protein HOY80DRAFT_1025874 [Tuber brumale]|nr:hypothetical protein HOY80DRAFT_1025874 [Tuber brumale]
MESSGCCVPSSTSGPRPNSKDSPSEQIPIMVEEILSTLRTGVYLGEAQNVVVRLCRVGDSRIGEVISETEYPRLVPGEKRSLLIKVDLGNPTALTATHIEARDPTGHWSTVEKQINSTQANRGSAPLQRISTRAPLPHCKPNSLPPPRIHRSRQSPMGNTCTEFAARRWRACTPIQTAFLVKSKLFVPVRGGEDRFTQYLPGIGV